MAIDYSTPITSIDGTEGTLEPYRHKVLLIVNTASQCGFTPQYKGLEELWRRYGEAGLVILGFPCDQFGHQEPGSEAEIQEFCELNYAVTFPMHAKIDVNGDTTHPLFEQLKDGAPGLLGSRAIKWNFTKFLVARDGAVLGRFGSTTTPEALAPEIEKALGT